MGVSKEIGSGSEGFIQVTGNNAKFDMQNLNDRLASYIETVRNLEKENYKMELKITEALQNSGPDLRDCSKYHVFLEDLRKKVRRGHMGGGDSRLKMYICSFIQKYVSLHPYKKY